MLRYGRALLTCLIATIALAAAVGTAEASRGLSINSPLTDIQGNLNIVLQGGFQIVCNVRFGIGFMDPRTIAKTNLAVFGLILLSGRGSTVFNCGAGAGLTILNDMLIRYRAFQGTLPNIAGINTRVNNPNFNFSLPPFFPLCIYNGGFIDNILFTRNPTTGLLTQVTIGAGAPAFTMTAAGCPNASLSGTFMFLTQPTVTLI